MNNDHKMYLYEQCRRFAAADCPDELQGYVDDVAHNAFAKALKELPNLHPQPGKTMENCIEALACLRVIDAYRSLKMDKERNVREATPVTPTDTMPDEDAHQVEMMLPDSCDAVDRLVAEIDAHFVPEWVREFRRVRNSLYGRDRELANAILAEADRTVEYGRTNRVNRQSLRAKLRMSRREYDYRLGRLRRRFRKAWDLFKDYYTK